MQIWGFVTSHLSFLSSYGSTVLSPHHSWLIEEYLESENISIFHKEIWLSSKLFSHRSSRIFHCNWFISWNNCGICIAARGGQIIYQPNLTQFVLLLQLRQISSFLSIVCHLHKSSNKFLYMHSSAIPFICNSFLSMSHKFHSLMPFI